MIDKRVDVFTGISKLPIEMQTSISDCFNNGGILKSDKVREICLELSIGVEALMLLLLPVAECFACAAISSFNVGAVARGVKDGTEGNKGYPNLYLGANFEYENLSLNFSIHAEQSAVSNAWLNGENTIASIATSAAPCGHCRQFLYEISGTKNLSVIIPDETTKEVYLFDIQTLLPSAFGPKQLGCDELLMQVPTSEPLLELKKIVYDELISKTLEQAKLSYAPYTKNYAACSIELNNGSVFFGRYAENAAHNPSLSAFSSAVSQVVMSQYEPLLVAGIKRAIFVENSTLSSQKKYAELLLSNLTNDIELEYYQAG